jgi:hypothetical protein
MCPAGIFAYVLLLIQGNYFVIVEGRQEGETSCVNHFANQPCSKNGRKALETRFVATQLPDAR